MSLDVGSIVHTALNGVFGTETLPISHRGAATNNITCRVVSDQDEVIETDGVNIVARVLYLKIATGQTGFSAVSGEAEPVEPGDTVTRNSRVYACQAPIEKSVDGKTYLTRWVQRKHQAHGVKGS